MERSFDVALLREYSERQRNDADRIVMLCDAAQNLNEQIIALRKEVAELKRSASSDVALP